MNTRYVVAIEISSSKIIGAVGKIYADDGKLDVVAIEKETCEECVRFGIVQNVEETALRISRIVQRLENHHDVAPNKITGVYIGLAGRSLKSIEAEVSLNFPEETVITEKAVASLRAKAIDKSIDSSLEVIDAVPRFFTIGKSHTSEPLGNLATSVKAIYDLIVCRPQLKRNILLTNISERYGIDINGFIVTPLAVGTLIPTESEKRLGCMLVDLGAETTSVTIYKDGNLRYFATLPLGSRNITRDITTLNFLKERAESLKIQNGSATRTGGSYKLNIHGVNHSEISNIIASRAEEIMVNVMEQIKFAGMKETDLSGGIILVGGGSALTNIETLINEISNLPVRNGQLPSYITLKTQANIPTDLEVICVLYSGATRSDAVCLSRRAADLPENGSDAVEEEYNDDEGGLRTGGSVTVKKNRLKSMWEKISGILTPEDDDTDLDE